MADRGLASSVTLSIFRNSKILSQKSQECTKKSQVTEKQYQMSSDWKTEAKCTVKNEIRRDVKLMRPGKCK